MKTAICSLSGRPAKNNPRPGSAWPNVLWRMPPSCVEVFAHLVSLAECGSTVELGLRELAEITGYSHEQVRRAIKRLAGAHLVLWINRGRGRGRKSRFRVLWRFYPRNVTPGMHAVAQSSRPSFSSGVTRPNSLGEGGSPLSHTLSPLKTENPEKGTAQKWADWPEGQSALPPAAKILRRAALLIRQTILFDEEEFGELDGVWKLEYWAGNAILVGLWRLRRYWADPQHVWGAVHLVVYRIRSVDTWCWRWWLRRGVRAVYALITRWVKEALCSTARLFTHGSPSSATDEDLAEVGRGGAIEGGWLVDGARCSSPVPEWR